MSSSVTLGAWGASAGFNALFGWKLGGDSELLRWMWLVFFVSMDGMKAYGGMIFSAALRDRQPLRILLAAGLVAAGTVMSLIAAFQWRTLAAAEAAAARQAIVDQRGKLELSIAQDRVKASQLVARALATIDAEIAGLKLSKRYTTSQACTDVTRADSRTICVQLAALSGERERASQRAYREKAVSDAETTLAKLKVPTEQADPMAASIASLLASFGVEADTARLADQIAALITLLAEFASIAGPMLISADRSPAAPRKPRQLLRAWPRVARSAAGRHSDYPATAFVPADGRRLSRDEAFEWIAYRARQDERVKWDGESIRATNAHLALVWGRPTSTVHDWINAWAIEGRIEKKAGAGGTRIRVLSDEC